jgi:chitin disaccharide deacetylase
MNTEWATPLASETRPSPISDAKSSNDGDQSVVSRQLKNEGSRAGLLIINADDWGRDRETTDRIFDCVVRGTVTSASAMVFMEDSERAASIAKERRFDAGLHINFTTPFSAPNAPDQLKERHQKIAAFLLRRRLNQTIFHPGLARSFEYVMAAQMEEYCRLYGAKPKRLDGHHHMHLCANVLLARLLPPGTIVRRNFSFQPGEKSALNRFYRKVIDKSLAGRHRLTDYLFSLQPLEPRDRLRRIFSLASVSSVEVETHPINGDEHSFLMSEEILLSLKDIRVASPSTIPLVKIPAPT